MRISSLMYLELCKFLFRRYGRHYSVSKLLVRYQCLHSALSQLSLSRVPTEQNVYREGCVPLRSHCPDSFPSLVLVMRSRTHDVVVLSELSSCGLFLLFSLSSIAPWPGCEVADAFGVVPPRQGGEKRRTKGLRVGKQAHITVAYQTTRSTIDPHFSQNGSRQSAGPR
jgi:hypothetical protein